MMTVREAQAILHEKQAAFEVDKAQVRAAHQRKREVAIDLECGLLLDTDPAIAEADRTFNACRLVAWQSRQAVEAAQQVLAEAQKRESAGPSRFEKALAWGRETYAEEYQRYQQYSTMFKSLREGIDPTYGRYESATRKAHNELIRVYAEAQEVAS